MIDLETLGNTPGCVVLSISIVCIEDVTLNNTWYLNVGSQLGKGLHIDQETHDWWMNQNSNVRRRTFAGNQIGNALVIKDILAYIVTHFSTDYQIWSDSPRLDYGCLDALLRAYGIKYPFFYRNERCLRTLMRIADELGVSYTPLAKTHDSYEDCVSQITTFKEIQTKLGNLIQK